MIENDDNKLYMLFGSDYMLIPEQLRQLLLQVHDLHGDKKEFLLPLEEGIKTAYDSYRRVDHWYGSTKCEERRGLQILLEARRQVMNKLFHLTEENYNQFLRINNTLLDLSCKTCKKMDILYRSWLKDEEEDWRNDCQVSGRIIAEGWKEEGTDETESDYETMMQIIEEVGNRELYESCFSGMPDCVINKLIECKRPMDSYRLFSFGGPHPYGDFSMCKAFNKLYTESLYSKQDILRIEMFWADVNFTHQRIVTPEGKLL